MATPSFLGIPVDIRLVIFDVYLSQHQSVWQKRQPNNYHLVILHTCRKIYEEAGPIFRRYVSLRNEFQINSFVLNASDSLALHVLWADVANDSRVFKPFETSKQKNATPTPLSNLHLALRRMPSLQRLRVFQCLQGLPTRVQRSNIARLAIHSEFAMYPSGSAPRLSSYELFLDAETRAQPFEAIPSKSVNKLRLSGEVQLQPRTETSALRDMTLHSITGNHFDQHNIDQTFPGACLEQFSYAQGHKLGFELRTRHLEAVVAMSGSRMRTLVLLGCSRITSTAIAACLEQLPLLETFALSLITVDEMRTNFLLSLPPRVSKLKLHVINAWYAAPLLAEERGLCNVLEGSIMTREAPPARMFLNFRERLLLEDGRRERWTEIARVHQIALRIGSWESNCEHAL